MVGFAVLVAAVGILAWWLMSTRRSRSEGVESGREGVREFRVGGGWGAAARPPEAAGLTADLTRWIEAGLISPGQADAIAAFENERAGPPRRVSLLAEALGYLGAVLFGAGAAVALGHAWDDLATEVRVAIAAGVSVLLLAGGVFLRSSVEAAFQRLMQVLWLLGVGAAAWTLGILAAEGFDLSPERSVLLVGTGVAVVAGVLWWWRPAPLQQAALFGSLGATLIGLLLLLPEPRPAWAFSLAVWGFAAAWALLGWYDRISPPWVAVALGSLGAMIAPSTGLDEHGWLLAPALATAAGAVAASVPTRQIPLLALGSIGAFAYVTWAVLRYFGDTLGVPLALSIVGAVFLTLAVLAGRLGHLLRLGRDPGR